MDPFSLLRDICIGCIILALFLAWAYRYSPAGPWLQGQINDIAHKAPGIPSATGLPHTGAPSATPSVPGAVPTNPSVADHPGAFSATEAKTIDPASLANLDIEERAVNGSYDRLKDFGQAWLDVDHNGCDTRNDVLKRDLADAHMKGTSRCVVQSGTLVDPYSGTTINFTRHQVSAVTKVGQYIDIDHVVPLKVVWYSGASSWTLAQREAIANDPQNLVSADAYTNRNMKGDKSIGQWAPSAQPGRCQYAAAYAHIVEKYDLSVSRDDATALQRFAAQCH